MGGTHSPPRPSCVASGRLSGSLSLRPHLQNGGTVLPFKGHQSAKHFTDPPSVVAADTPSSGLSSVSTLSPKGPWEARRPLPPASSAPEAPTTTRGFRRCQPVWLRPWLLGQQLWPRWAQEDKRPAEAPGRRSQLSPLYYLRAVVSVSPPSSGGGKPVSELAAGGKDAAEVRKRARARCSRGSGSTDTSHPRLVPKQVAEASAELPSPPRLLSNGKTPAGPTDIKPSQTTTGPFSFPFNLTDVTANSTREANPEERLRTVMGRRCGVDPSCQMRKHTQQS